MLILTGLGFLHLRRVPIEQEVFTKTTHREPATTNRVTPHDPQPASRAGIPARDALPIDDLAGLYANGRRNAGPAANRCRRETTSPGSDVTIGQPERISLLY